MAPLFLRVALGVVDGSDDVFAVIQEHFPPAATARAESGSVRVVEGVEKVANPTELDEGSYEWIPVDDVPRLIAEGKVRNSGTLVGLLHYLALGAGQDRAETSPLPH